MEIEKFVHLNKLYMVYKNLLTDKQREILAYFLDEDFSLGEISEEIGISRQAVHDTVKRSEQILSDYEKKLGMLHKEEFVARKANDMLKLVIANKELDQATREKMISICKELI